LQRAEEDVGKLLISYVPSGMKRISMLVILDFETDSVI
jgi:hypothetical protein